MSIKVQSLKRWDSADYLEDDEEIQAYLDACSEESNGDPSFVIHALATIARAKNMSQLARETGISREGLYKALSPNGNPTLVTVSKLATALGLTLKLDVKASAP